ncbi:MAG: rhodanese-related sulfurtransferase [Propionibacteriaceae bacterium]|nr:rhodanese-related sulfurtransferase [Propionibacteriaceae bacterium]
MAVAKILLFYRFVPLADPEAVKLWQLELCTRLGLRGRIIVSPHGINGTLGGELDACKSYLKATKRYAPFKELDEKWSAGTGLDADGGSLDFPRLSVKSRPELVAFGAPEAITVDADGVVGGGARLTPDQVDALVAERPEAVFFDGRNKIEAEVGHFEGAVVPDVVTTHDFIAELDSGKYDHLKQRPVITYCTGGVRCEILSKLMLDRGFGEVYQIDGGIVRYLERFGGNSLWKGALTVFDGRETIAPQGAEHIGRCHRCQEPTSDLVNCADLACRVRLVTCPNCAATPVGCFAHPVQVG